MKMLLFMLVTIGASGCAALDPAQRPVNYQGVVVDPSVCKKCDYATDIYQCNNIAHHNTNYAGNALGGAAVGAATGAIFGAILGLDIGTLAAAGAAGGGIGGLGNEAATVRQMVVNCMRGRGYSVLR
jgi:uncharacterized protein YcfJ